MAWNQPGDDQGSKPRGSGLRASGGSLWSRLRQRWNATPQARGPFFGAAAGLAAVLWLCSGFYQVDDGERGVLQRFGAYEGLRASGAGWHLPWPIETLTPVNLDKLNSTDFQARMLTAEGMLVNVSASIDYRYADARAALFALRDPDSVVRELGEAATRELVGQRHIEELMKTASRPELAPALRSAVQEPLDAMGAGVRVMAVTLADVQVPDPVLSAQRELVQASADRDRLVHDARSYTADLVPAAQAAAQRERLDAETYQAQTLGVAEGEAARFAPLAAAYARAPEVTRNQMYIETIESILAHSRKVIIDGKGNNTLVLPLDKLNDAGALKALGVTGIAPAPGTAAGATAGAALPPAPSSASPATGTAATGAAPATGAPPAAGAAPASDRADRDDRGRERGERR
jgi:modulator of FtsH protease HflK